MKTEVKTAEQIISKARVTLSMLCKDPRRFLMTIPVDMERDTDIIMADVINLATRLQSENAELKKENERLQVKYVDRGIYIRTLESEIINLKSSLPE